MPAASNETMIVRLAEIEVYPQYLTAYLDYANEVDRPLPEIQTGHAPHGGRPETAHDEAPRPRNDETDIQEKRLIPISC